MLQPPLAILTLTDEYKIEISHVLYCLCSFVSSGTCLRKFEVDLRMTGYNVLQAQLEGICYPLVMLGKLDSLVIRSSNNHTARFSQSAYVNASVGGISHAGSALLPALPLIEDVMLYEDLAEIVLLGSDQNSSGSVAMLGMHQSPPKIQYPSDWSHVFEARDALTLQLNGDRPLNVATGAGGMYDGNWERATRTATTELQQAFMNLHVPGLFPRHGKDYRDVIMALEEWRVDRMAFRGINGMAACAEQAMTASETAPVPQPDYQSMSTEEVSEWYRESVKSRPLESSLALLVIRRRVLKQHGLINDFEASRFDDKSEWLPLEESDEVKDDGGDDGEDGGEDDKDEWFSDSDADDADEVNTDDESEQGTGLEQGTMTDQAGSEQGPGQDVDRSDLTEAPRRSCRKRSHRRRSTSPGPATYSHGRNCYYG